MKKILLLSDINSSHTQKWVVSLAEKGFTIGVFTLSKPDTNWYQQFPLVKVFGEQGFAKNTFYRNAFQKIVFLSVLPALKKVIKEFKPDILHAHYASSYGLLGALTKFHPFIISVWGSDVFDFPKQNLLNKYSLTYSFKKADLILSTSEALRKETSLYTNKSILLTPFGIDLNLFKPAPRIERDENQITIGTIKSLEEVYGIDDLMRSFKVVRERNPGLQLKLLIVGGGSKSEAYKKLSEDLQLNEQVVFSGRISYNEVVKYHNMIDIFVALSMRESFGVAVLEASACEKPVVVSNAGGLPEVVQHGVTGYIVPVKNIEAAALAIEKLVLDKELRRTFGANGRKMVVDLYDWNLNLSKLLDIYNNLPI